MDASGNTTRVKLTKDELLERRKARDEAAGFTPEMRAEAQAKLKVWYESYVSAKKRR
jgi:hypothetical protein